MKSRYSMIITAPASESSEQRTLIFRYILPGKRAAGLLTLLMLAGQAGAYESYSEKKGVGQGHAGRIEALKVSWYYNWNNKPVEVTNPESGSLDPSIEYVPMRHNRWWSNLANLADLEEFNYFLGYNEPERSDQGDITVDQAIAQWPDIEQAVADHGPPGVQIGSPATANPEHPWIIDFMTKAETGNLQVDFMAMHKYPKPDSSGSVINGAQWYYDTYGKDVWITEFNAADWSAPNDYTQAHSYTWMVEVLFRMESTHYIKRYAIFPWNGTSSASEASPIFTVDAQGNTTTELTPLGKLYAEYHSNDINGPYTQIRYHLHNKGRRMRLYDDAGTPSTADIFTEGDTVEFELALAGSGNYYIINQGTGEYLGSDGATTYWTDSETGSSVQWNLTASIYNWLHISHVGSGNYLYGQNTGDVGLNPSPDDGTYEWTFIRTGTPRLPDPPVFVAMDMVGTNVNLTWSSHADATYNILSTTVLTNTAWITNKSGIVSAGDTTSNSVSTVGDAGFYRVESE